MIRIIYLPIFIISGIMSWRKILPGHKTLETLLLGGVWGSILACFVPFLLSLFIPFKTAVLISCLLAFSVALILGFIDKNFWLSEIKRIGPLIKQLGASKKLIMASLTLLAVPYLILVSRTLFIDNNGSYSTGFAAALGDVPSHLMYIYSFALGDNFPPQNPDFAGVASNYPFATYFSSAAMLVSGASLVFSFLAPILILHFLIIFLLFYLAWRITKNATASILAPFIFLFSGGLGFYWFFQKHGFGILSEKIGYFSPNFGLLTNIPGTDINFMNVLISSLGPQRGILFGLPIFLAVILLWQIGDRRSIIASAVLVAFLPLFSAHTFIAIIIILPFHLLILFIRNKQKRIGTDYLSWIIFSGSVFLAFILVFFLTKNNETGSYIKSIRLTNGWMLDGENFILHWIKNLGFFLFAIIGALLYKKIPARQKLWYIPLVALFIIPNFIIFTPWEWDNSKFFHLWYSASAVMVSLFIAILFKNKKIIVKIIAAVLFFLVILSGGIDVLKAWQISKSGFGLFDSESQRLANFIEQSTPPSAVFLASTSHLSPVILSGRKRLVGYTGWLWSRGIDYSQRLEDIRVIFSGDGQAFNLINEYGIEYFLISPQEKNEFSVNMAFFEDNFHELYNENSYQIFIKK